MSFRRPTLQEIQDRVAARFSSRIKNPDGTPIGQLVRGGPLEIISNAVAGESNSNFGKLDDNAQQTFPDSADSKYVERYATQRGVPRKAAAPASGTVSVLGTVGAVIPVGTLLQRPDGVRYSVPVETTLASSPQDLPVVAVVAGAAGNLAIGLALRFSSGVPFVQAVATVLDDGSGRGLAGGLDVESDARLLERLSQIVKTPPQGGAVADYIKWSLEVPGVTRVWVRPLWMGKGSVGVSFVVDDDPISIIPTVQQVEDLQCYLDARRPVTADVFVFAPTPLAVDFEILLDPDTTAVRAAVRLALEDLIAREAELGGTIPLSHIREAISTAAGENDSTVLAPVAAIVALAYQLAVPGSFTWT